MLSNKLLEPYINLPKDQSNKVVNYDRKHQAEIILTGGNKGSFIDQGGNETSVSKKNLLSKPPIKFIGNARLKMLCMSPDQISDLKKNQQLFPVKNQIDGKTLDIKSSLSRKGFRLSPSKASSLENNGIDKQSYNGVSDDVQE